jgi:hypothetical protein
MGSNDNELRHKVVGSNRARVSIHGKGLRVKGRSRKKVKSKGRTKVR